MVSAPSGIHSRRAAPGPKGQKVPACLRRLLVCGPPPDHLDSPTAPPLTLEVVRLLIDNGMKPSQVGAAGYAEYDPAADNATADGQKQNRRIEIVVEPNLSELPSLEGIVTK